MPFLVTLIFFYLRRFLGGFQDNFVNVTREW